MTNRELMHTSLKKTVFPYLAEKGFEGEYPHFRRKNKDCIELISFAVNPSGGSFGICVSAAFPQRKNTNLIWFDDIEKLTAFHTKVRYHGMEMFEESGEYFYSDVYSKRTQVNWFRSRTSYVAAQNEKQAAMWRSEGYECVKRFNQETPDEICASIMMQLGDAFSWMKKLDKKSRL